MGLKRHGSKSDKFSAGYSRGLAAEYRYGESPIRKKIEDFSANKLMSKIPFKENKEFSEGYELGKKDMNKAVKANKKEKKEEKEKGKAFYEAQNPKKSSGGAVKGYAPGGAIKRVKPLTSEILSATDKRRRKQFLAKSGVPKKRPGKKVKYVRAASGGAVHRMPDGTIMAGAKHGMKKGGKVKKCRMDGIALRGKTRAKQRSK